MDIRCIGVSTGGGDCPGLNAVIRSVVKTAICKFKWEVIGIQDGFDGLINMKETCKLTLSRVRGILPKGGTILGTNNRGNPFKQKIEKDGQVVEIDLSHKVIENIKTLNIDALIVIGGDGTLRISYELYKKGAPIIGIPKTIDNDLDCTDYTFGFDTAVNTAMEAIDKLHTTAESHHRIMILEVMGRNAGWIALEAGIAGGADVILIPEIPYDINRVCQKFKDRNRHGSKFSIVVVAEGAKPVGGETITHIVDSSGTVRLGGIAHKLATDIGRLTGLETRVTTLGHLQRGGSPTAFDRILGTRFGAEAVYLAAKKEFGKMACLKTPLISSVELEKAVKKLKLVDPQGQLVRAAKDTGIEFGG